MHRLPTNVPAYRLHKSKGLARVIIDGRHIYLGKYNSTESWEKYRKLIAEWMVAHRAPEEPTTAAIQSVNLSIAGLVARYLEFAESYYSKDGKPSSEFVSMRDAVRPLCELHASTAVTEFGPLALKAVRQRMIERDWCRRRINHQVNRIRRVFRWGVENELVPANILHALQAVAGLKRGRSPARESEPVQPVPPEYVEPVLQHVSAQVGTMIQLQQLTGMRPGEVVLVRPGDIDTSGSVWTYRPVEHKTAYQGHQRIVYIGPRAQKLLRPWLERPANSYCFSPLEAEATRNSERKRRRKSPMTPSQAKRRPKTRSLRAKRDRYDTFSYRRAIKYAIDKAAVPSWHPHQLRHSAATELRKQFGLDVAQVILGHRSAEVTQVYAEADRQKAVEVMKIVG